MQGGKPCIAAADAVMAIFLKMVEEPQDELRVEVVERQMHGGFVQLLLGIPKDHPECVPVRLDGSRAGVFLTHQAIDEKSLDERGKLRGLIEQGAHGRLPRKWRRKRSAAMLINSGTALQYQ